MALEKVLEDFEKALNRLKEAHLRTKIQVKKIIPFLKIVLFRDLSLLLRFSGKASNLFLKEVEGIECRSPKSCIREFFSAGYLDEKETIVLSSNDR